MAVEFSERAKSSPPAAPQQQRGRGLRVLVSLVVVLAVVLGGLVPGVAFAAGFTKADGGHVVVVRNGGPFDDNSIRQVIHTYAPGTGFSVTGQ